MELDRASVVLVDQDPQLRSVVKSAIKERGEAEVHEAADGEQAIYLLEQHEDIGFVLADAVGPVTGGWELASIILDPYNGWLDTRVAVCSDVACAELALKAWCLGVGFYCKPLNIPAIIEDIFTGVLEHE